MINAIAHCARTMIQRQVNVGAGKARPMLVHGAGEIMKKPNSEYNFRLVEPRVNNSTR